jgi:hypothetical protein
MIEQFVHPNWFEGTLIMIGYFAVPIIIGIIVAIFCVMKEHEGIAFVVMMLAVVMAMCGSQVLWFENYEVPSVQEEIITVDDWQPTFNHYWGDVDGADDLMLKTTDGELFGNTENLLFQKFNTRDILDQLKPNGTYKIKYYGWREGFNSGVPNILSVEQVINESNCPAHHDISNYMNKRSIIYSDDDHW